MTQKLLHFKGPYGDQTQIPARDGVHYERLKKRTVLYDFEIVEHLHSDFFQLFFIEEGGGMLLSQGNKYNIVVPSIIVIPSSVMHGFVFQEDIAGHVLSVPQSLIEDSLITQTKLQFAISKFRLLTFENTTADFLQLKQLMLELVDESDLKKIDHVVAIRLQMQLLALLLYRATKAKPFADFKTDNKMLNHFSAFQKSIKRHLSKSVAIKDYAEELSITPIHLNRICKLIVKKSALQVVHEILFNESKKYLSGTSNSIAEISYLLGFSDPSHFNKFFKKMAQQTPRQFRPKKV